MFMRNSGLAARAPSSRWFEPLTFLIVTGLLRCGVSAPGYFHARCVIRTAELQFLSVASQNII